MDQPSALERFLREIQAAAALDHRNIVRAYTATRSGGDLILIMEYVEGEDLGARVDRLGSLPVAEACFDAFQAAQGLQHAHSRGMVHRDIKPQNVILDVKGGKGLVKILDFGLAKIQSEGPVGGGITRDNSVLGSADYVAPEQIRDAKTADIRADIYGLGCTLHHLLSGSAPFAGAKSLYDIFQAHMSQDAAPLNGLRSDVPVELGALVAKMMAKNPEDRFQTPGEVAAALRPFVQAGTAAVAPGTLAKPAPGPRPARSGTLVEGVPPVAPAARRSTIAEGVSPAPLAARQSTIAEDLPLADAPILPAARRSTLVEGRPPIGLPPRVGSRRSTIAEDGAPGPFSRDATLDEALPQRGGKPTKSKIRAPEPTPISRRPEVLAAVGIVAAVSVGLGLYLGRSGSGAKEKKPQQFAFGPKVPKPGSRGIPINTGLPKPGEVPPDSAIPGAIPNGLTPPKYAPANPTAKTKTDGSMGDAKTKSPKGEVAPADDTDTKADDAPDPDPEDVGPAKKTAPRTDGVDEEDFQIVAQGPDRFEGKTIVPKGYWLTTGHLFFDRVPKFGVMLVKDKKKVTLCDDSGNPKDSSLGIVLEEALARKLSKLLESKNLDKGSKVDPKLRFLPTFVVRKEMIQGSPRWLAVIVAMEFATAPHNDRIMEGDGEGAYDLYHVDANRTRAVSSGGDTFERLGGLEDRQKLRAQIRRSDVSTRRAEAKQRLAEGQAAVGGAMQGQAAREQQKLKKQQDDLKRASGQ